MIKIPEANKLLIGDGGAGKNPDAADEVFRTRYEDILRFLEKDFWYRVRKGFGMRWSRRRDRSRRSVSGFRDMS